jgi:hypothetical protein
MALKLRGKLSIVVAALVIMLLAACDTQPATDVTTDAATLNAKGKCEVKAGGYNQYQLRDYDANGGWFDVGPGYRFDCPGPGTSDVALQSYRVGGLKPANAYEFRLVSRMDNGSTQIWNSGDGTYDWFTTKSTVSQTAWLPAEEFINDPETGEASASTSDCRWKEIKNVRQGMASGVLVFWVTERTQWKFCRSDQQIRKSNASASCTVNALGSTYGFKCLDPNGVQVRSVSYGGSPEHSEYTYKYRLEQSRSIKGIKITFWSSTWCTSNAISGSGAHRRSGSCDPIVWEPL